MEENSVLSPPLINELKVEKETAWYNPHQRLLYHHRPAEVPDVGATGRF